MNMCRCFCYCALNGTFFAHSRNLLLKYCKPNFNFSRKTKSMFIFSVLTSFSYLIFTRQIESLFIFSVLTSFFMAATKQTFSDNQIILKKSKLSKIDGKAVEETSCQEVWHDLSYVTKFPVISHFNHWSPK